LNVPDPDDGQPNGFVTLKLPEAADVDENVPLIEIDGLPPTDSEKLLPVIALAGVNVVVVVPLAVHDEPVVDQFSVNVEMALPVTVNVNVFPCDVVPLQLPS
jgi:hypothetical protein